MKKIILLPILIISTILSSSCNDDNFSDNTVNIIIIPKKETGKNEAIMPKIKFNADSNLVKVTFKTDGNYMINITDDNGKLECCFKLNSTDIRQNFYLPKLHSGTYTITLDGENHTYQGEISIIK